MSKAIPVSFKNKETDLLEFVQDKDFSYYVKNLIRKDMLSQDLKPVLKYTEEKPKPRRNANFEM